MPTLSDPEIIGIRLAKGDVVLREDLVRTFHEAVITNAAGFSFSGVMTMKTVAKLFIAQNSYQLLRKAVQPKVADMLGANIVYHVKYNNYELNQFLITFGLIEDKKHAPDQFRILNNCSAGFVLARAMGLSTKASADYHLVSRKELIKVLKKAQSFDYSGFSDSDRSTEQRNLTICFLAIAYVLEHLDTSIPVVRVRDTTSFVIDVKLYRAIHRITPQTVFCSLKYKLIFVTTTHGFGVLSFKTDTPYDYIAEGENYYRVVFKSKVAKTVDVDLANEINGFELMPVQTIAQWRERLDPFKLETEGAVTIPYNSAITFKGLELMFRLLNPITTGGNVVFLHSYDPSYVHVRFKCKAATTHFWLKIRN